MKNYTELDASIFKAIDQNSLSDQKSLQECLEKSGLSVAQATLSRRLKALNIVKIGGKYAAVESGKAPSLKICKVQSSDDGMIVVHTNPGDAGGVGYALDRDYVGKKPGVLGTIAGDDTVLIVMQNKIYAEEMVRELIRISTERKI